MGPTREEEAPISRLVHDLDLSWSQSTRFADLTHRIVASRNKSRTSDSSSSRVGNPTGPDLSRLELATAASVIDIKHDWLRFTGLAEARHGSEGTGTRRRVLPLRHRTGRPSWPSRHGRAATRHGSAPNRLKWVPVGCPTRPVDRHNFSSEENLRSWRLSSRQIGLIGAKEGLGVDPLPRLPASFDPDRPIRRPARQARDDYLPPVSYGG